MRTAFSETLIALAQADRRVLLLTGDHGYALFDAFRQACPSQFINAGVAEQNMIGVAAGLARGGFRPIVYGLSAFVPIRVIEQIKLDVARDNLPVILIGDGAGLVYSQLGCSHQSTEDIACLRALPNLQIYSPADRAELKYCFMDAFKSGNASYLRMGKSDVGQIHVTPVDAPRGSILPIYSGTGNLAMIATGAMTAQACILAKQHFPGTSLWSAPCIKPIEEQQIIEVCRTHRMIITIEEHSALGGLGSIICEIASKNAPTRILRIGTEDKFLFESGSYAHLLKLHQLDLSKIALQIKNYLKYASIENDSCQS